MDGDQPRSRQPVYSIGAVARMLQVPAATLRTWQERYGVVVPERSEGGHRLYSRDQVEQLRFMLDRVAEGLSPSDAHRLLRQRLGADDRLSLASGEPNLLILIAERDPFSAEFAEYFLRTEGYDVAVVPDVEAALARAADSPPDVAVVDLLISGGRGLELCRRLRENSPAPILAVSTLHRRDAALDAGAAAFLEKPIEPLQLVSAVRDLLGRSAYLAGDKERGERESAGSRGRGEVTT